MNSLTKEISRRGFLTTASLGCASVLFPGFLNFNRPTEYAPRTRVPNPYVFNGKPILICVSGTNFQEMLQTGLEKIGGLNKLIDHNQNILIKPNLNSRDIYPAISSGESIKALIEEIKKVTTGEITVGDESFHSTASVYEYAHLAKYVEPTGAILSTFQGTYEVKDERWQVSKPNYKVFRQVYDSPIIINFACIKRHSWAKMTCALKNNVGTVAGSGASQTRAYLHYSTGERFLEEVAEIAAAINPELNIIDARHLLISNGPFSNSPGAQIKTGVNKLIICGDMVATDAYCAQILAQEDPSFSVSMISPTLHRASELGLGTQDLGQVEIIEVTTTSVDDSSSQRSIPTEFELYQNYPNPFNSETVIRYCTPTNSHVTLGVYNAIGRLVKTLVSTVKPAGTYSVHWNGDDDFGYPLASGSYFYRLKTENLVITRQAVLLR